jgi:hypothetical protein
MRRSALPFAFLGILILAAVACGNDTPTEPELGEPDATFLFVGNSLTATNNLPSVVNTVAEAAGVDIETQVVALANFSLQDHWGQGLENFIRTVQPDVVVLQQGPSSLPQNQLNLREWTDSIARVVREVGGEPALLMVWPTPDRRFAFDDVRDAYLNAASGVGGTFVPAGEVMRVLLDEGSPELAPFAGDGFHPSPLGTVSAALALVGTLFDREVSELPVEMPAGSRGGVAISIPPSTAEFVFAVTDSVVAAWEDDGG